jgi:hypothetical protein
MMAEMPLLKVRCLRIDISGGKFYRILHARLHEVL